MIKTFEQFVNEQNIYNDKNKLIVQLNKHQIIEKIIDAIDSNNRDDYNVLSDKFNKYLEDEIKYFESTKIEVLLDDENEINDLLGLNSFTFNNELCEIYSVCVYYNLVCDHNDGNRAFAYFKLESFNIDTDFGTITNEDVRVTEQTHKDLFKSIDIDTSNYFN